MDVSVNAVIRSGVFPLIVILHGNGGSYPLYRLISSYLAQNGYIVAMPEHYGNNRNNNTLENTIENLKLRLRHVTLIIDALLEADELFPHILKDCVGLIGHSTGGYTALALAGGVPVTQEGQRVETAKDEQVKAIVLLAPGTGWFRHGLNQVTISMMMLTAEHDEITPDWNAAIVLKHIARQDQIRYRMIPNAGHFFFFKSVSTKPEHTWIQACQLSSWV